MRGNELLDAMELAAPAYIEAAEAVPPAKKRRWIKWAAAAVCLCLTVSGGLLYKGEHPYPVIYETAAGPQGSEIAEVPHWEDMAIYAQYFEIELNGSTYTARSGQIPPEKLGRELARTTAGGWDEYAAVAGEDPNRYTDVTVYEISGISPDCAAAVLYHGSDVYYAAVNSYYCPDTLGQFIDDLDLKNTAVFNCAYYEFKKISGKYACARFDGLDGNMVWEMLLSAPEAENRYDDLNFQQPDKILDISVSIPLLGYENISLSICEGGYIITNILDTGKMFCIGEENTEAFIDYVLHSCEGHELMYEDSGPEDSVPE